MGRAEIHGRSRLKTIVLSILALVLSLVSASQSQAQIASKPRIKPVEFVPGEFVAKTKRPIESANAQKLSATLGVAEVEQITDDTIVIRQPGPILGTRFMNVIKKNPMIEIVEPNYIYRINKLPNDPDFSKLWGLKNQGLADKEGSIGVENVDVGVERAWDITTGSKKIVVAVIDTGVFHTHPDLVDNMWVNQAEKNGAPGVDDDQNGFIDDIHGYDFVNNDGDPNDDNGHGTHCAGTIGATGNDGKGLVGVNWDVSIMGLKFLSGEGSGTLEDAIRAIDYATKMKVDIMSNSWGGGGVSELLKESIKKAADAGILFVAAAGNESSDNDAVPAYPANYDVDNVVSVAAIDNRGELAYFSNYGAKLVHVAAPGHNILSTVPNGTDVYSGTSMATPHVSGVAALLLADRPNLSYREIKERLIRTSKPLAGLKGQVVSGGVVDAFYALTNTRPPPDPNDPELWPSKRRLVIATEHPYKDDHKQTWRIKIPKAKKISLFFSRFETEAGWDKLVFKNAEGKVMGVWSGRRDQRYSPIISGDTVILEFSSDHAVNGYGFEVDHVAYE